MRKEGREDWGFWTSIMVMGSIDLVDWWDTPLLSEHDWDDKWTDSFTGGHMEDH